MGTDTSLPLRVASTPVIWAILCLWLWPETRHLLGAVHAAGFRVHHRRAPSRDVSPVAPVEATDDARIDGF